MLVKEIMTSDPECCTAQTSLQETARMMVDCDCGCIPVVDSKESRKPVGVITDRDICCRVVAEGRDPAGLTAGDAMTASAVTVTPETSVEDCCKLMEDSQIRRIVVVDSSGACCGIVAQADVAKSLDSDKTAEVVQEVSRASA
jgi:CBS domain-containing protein